MKILITGVAGFVGSNLAVHMANTWENVSLIGIDNLSRRGSENNLPLLKQLDCQFMAWFKLGLQKNGIGDLNKKNVIQGKTALVQIKLTRGGENRVLSPPLKS